MIRVRFHHPGAKAQKVARHLRRVSRNVVDHSPVMPRILQLLADAAKQRILEGRVPGPALDSITQLIRKRRGFKGKPALVRSGDLLNAISPKLPSFFGPTGLDWPVAKLHDGGRVKTRNGRTVDLPPRRFLDPEPADLDQMADLLDGHIRSDS